MYVCILYLSRTNASLKSISSSPILSRIYCQTPKTTPMDTTIVPFTMNLGKNASGNQQKNWIKGGWFLPPLPPFPLTSPQWESLALKLGPMAGPRLGEPGRWADTPSGDDLRNHLMVDSRPLAADTSWHQRPRSGPEIHSVSKVASRSGFERLKIHLNEYVSRGPVIVSHENKYGNATEIALRWKSQPEGDRIGVELRKCIKIANYIWERRGCN